MWFRGRRGKCKVKQPLPLVLRQNDWSRSPTVARVGGNVEQVVRSSLYFQWEHGVGNALCMCVCTVCVSHSAVSDSASPWTVAHQAPLSMQFSRQEYWSGLPFPSQGEHPDPGIECRSPVLQADSLSLSHQESLFNHYFHCNCPMSRAIQTVKTILKEWRNRFNLLMGEATHFP